jgi:hypothetical protein
MKRYLNKFVAGAFVLGAMVTTTSCGSDYLDTTPTASVGTSTAIGSAENAMKALNGIARMMTTQHYYFSQGMCGENYIMNKMESYPSPNFNYNYYAAGWAPLINMQYHARTTSIYDAYAWYYYYSLIGDANTIICNIDNAEGTAADKEFVKASALTFRAYAYEKLCHYYCWRWQDSSEGASQGLVLRLDESTGSMPYSTLAETYAQIYKDCEEAISLFESSGEDRSSGDVWIPNVNVAHAVYARAALTKQDYKTAAAQAKLARQGYPLMSNADYVAGFCKPTSEWIFGAYGSANENNWYWSYGTQFACNGYYATSQPTGAGSIGRELINRIPNNDVRKSLFLTEDKFPDYDFSASNPNSYLQTYCIMGVSHKGLTEEQAAKDDALWDEVDAYIESMTPSGLERAYQSGYFYLDGQLKFWVFDTPGVGYLPFIRSSEMVLVEAEANYFLGNTTEAQNALVELNATSGRNPEYTCSLTGEDLFNEIKDYREVELWGECSWSDYKRWNLPMSRGEPSQVVPG